MDTSTTFSSDATTYIADKTLTLAEKSVRFYEAADKAKLPDHNSKTFQYSRYERLGLPLSSITEGVDPSDSGMTVTTVTAIAEQLNCPAVLKSFLNNKNLRLAYC